MASALKKVAHLKQVMKPLQKIGFGHHKSSLSDSDTIESDSRRVPPHSLAVYVGRETERCRFVIPVRYLNFPVFRPLLKMSEQEFGFQWRGALVLPCEVKLFNEVLKLLRKDERRFGKMRMEEFLKMFADQERFDACREGQIDDPSFTPLLKAVS